MDKETLSNYGWITITILVLSVMIALSTPFGVFIKTAITNTTTALIETSNKSMNTINKAISNDNTTDNEQGGEIDNTQNGTPDIGFEDSGDNDSETELPPSLDDEGAGGTSGDSYENIFG